MHKKTIIPIVGQSGSGKTALSLYLQENWRVPAVVSFTTRPMRKGEVNGTDHYFLPSDTPFPLLCLAQTDFAGYRYWTTPAQIDQLPSDVCTYVIDEKGLIDLIEHWGWRYEILPVKIVRPHNPTDRKRRARDKCRVYFPEDRYAAVIRNTGTLQSFLKSAAETICALTKAITAKLQ